MNTQNDLRKYILVYEDKPSSDEEKRISLFASSISSNDLFVYTGAEEFILRLIAKSSYDLSENSSSAYIIGTDRPLRKFLTDENIKPLLVLDMNGDLLAKSTELIGALDKILDIGSTIEALQGDLEQYSSFYRRAFKEKSKVCKEIDIKNMDKLVNKDLGKILNMIDDMIERYIVKQ